MPGVAKVLIKTLLVIGLVLLAGAPFFIEVISYIKDCKNKNSHKRLRVLVFSFVYWLAITLGMSLLYDLFEKVKQLKFILWIVGKIPLLSRLEYAVSVYSALLINCGIFALFVVLLRFVRIGLKKKKLNEEVLKPGLRKKVRELEIRIIRFFYKELWFVVRRILLAVNIMLTVGFGLMFVVFQLPALDFAPWIPFELVRKVFEAGYIYPAITLIPLWEAYFFLFGIEHVKTESEELLEIVLKTKKMPVNVDEVEKACHLAFSDFFACTPNIEGAANVDSASATHEELTLKISEAVNKDERCPQKQVDGYLECLDSIIKKDSAFDEPIVTLTKQRKTGTIVNGDFFSGFSAYFFRYLSTVLARGDNVVIICNNCQEAEETYSFTFKVLSEIYSLYCEDLEEAKAERVDFDNPVWKIGLVCDGHNMESDAANIDKCSVLVSDLNYLCTSAFFKDHKQFVSLINTVVYVDIASAVSVSSSQIALFDRTLRLTQREIERQALETEIRNDTFYTAGSIRYICFDSLKVTSLDKVLNDILSIEFDSVEAMDYDKNIIVSCYKFEGNALFERETAVPQFAKTEENLGVLFNFAERAVASGAGTVSVFAQGHIPYREVLESGGANTNSGAVLIKDHNAFVNSAFPNPNDYNVVVVFDDIDNLPAVIRRYVSRMPNEDEKKTYLVVFSRPYMLRDYYLDNIEALWQSDRIISLPATSTNYERNKHENGVSLSTLKKIIVKACAGGIREKELLSLLSEFSEYGQVIKNGDIVGVLGKLLKDTGVGPNEMPNSMVMNYFSFDTVRGFGPDGNYYSSRLIKVKRDEQAFFDAINVRSIAHIIINGRRVPLRIEKDRISQNYISGQNLLYDGELFRIFRIDLDKGFIHVDRAGDGINTSPYMYVQNREYHITLTDDDVCIQYEKDTGRKVFGDISVDEISIAVQRCPAEVLTKGYYPIDRNVLSANGVSQEEDLTLEKVYGSQYIDLTEERNHDTFIQTYRRYGAVEDPVCSYDLIRGSENGGIPSATGAKVMIIRIHGVFGKHPQKISLLAASMLGELLRSMYPDVSDCIAVCAIPMSSDCENESKDVSFDMESKDLGDIFGRVPKLVCNNYEHDCNSIELMVIEDCNHEVGVISSLSADGQSSVRNIFGYILSYLRWYSKTEQKSKYLYYGKPEEPDCFDFEGLLKLAELLGTESVKSKFVDNTDARMGGVCTFCGKSFLKGDRALLAMEDGRYICQECKKSIVGINNRENQLFVRQAKVFLESTYSVTINNDYKFSFSSPEKIVKQIKDDSSTTENLGDIPLISYLDRKNKTVYVDCMMPPDNIMELVARELAHIWQVENAPFVEDSLARGLMATVSVDYLTFLNNKTLACRRRAFFESLKSLAGEGYRTIRHALLKDSNLNNNPFEYIIALSGRTIYPGKTGTLDNGILAIGEFGAEYTPSVFDRNLNGNIPYYYREHLPDRLKMYYDKMVEAVVGFDEKVNLAGCSSEELRTVTLSVLYDRPDLFWYYSSSIMDDTAFLYYTASKEDVAGLQAAIDAEVADYLKDITDAMSAYDVALRLHVKMISRVDYDSVSLEKLKKETKKKNQNGLYPMDYLRTICGVFINRKAVCEGYARGIQYLLQKCGIECAECAGSTSKERYDEASSHAWILAKIDSEYYYIDTTWDDSSNTNQSIKNNDLELDYFCVTEEEVKRSRKIDMCPCSVPVCNAVKANWYYHNDLILETYDIDRIKRIAINAAVAGRGAFTFKCSSEQLFKETQKKLCVRGDDCYSVLKEAAKKNRAILTNTYKYSYNSEIRTITVRFKFGK